MSRDVGKRTYELYRMAKVNEGPASSRLHGVGAE